MLRLFLIIGALLFSLPSFAQQTVITRPYGVTTGNASSTITVTDTFQTVFAASTDTVGRTACTIQNNGTHTMYVFFGARTSATKDTSLQLAAGQYVLCSSGNDILKDEVSVTGTSGDKFYAGSQ